MDRRKIKSKIKFDSYSTEGPFEIFYYATHENRDISERSITITVRDDALNAIIFVSREFGGAEWTSGRGIHSAYRRENDPSRKGRARLDATTDWAFANVIPDVLDNMIDVDLATEIIKTIRRRKPVSFDLSLVTSHRPA
ncbi:MAG TPA: hypothetical protein PKK43_05595 [Spirochaetota bacterium]|nr:hypothetical protein [Spirochaetota bacterium]